MSLCNWPPAFEGAPLNRWNSLEIISAMASAAGVLRGAARGFYRRRDRKSYPSDPRPSISGSLPALVNFRVNVGMRPGLFAVIFIPPRVSSRPFAFSIRLAKRSRYSTSFLSARNPSRRSSIGTETFNMDAVIDMADAAHALDLDRIRFQLMYAMDCPFSAHV